MRWLLAGLVLAFAASSANAQLGPPNTALNSAGQIGQHGTRAQTDNEQKPKANDKAYNSALQNLPNKQYDPWHGVR